MGNDMQQKPLAAVEPARLWFTVGTIWALTATFILLEMDSMVIHHNIIQMFRSRPPYKVMYLHTYKRKSNSWVREEAHAASDPAL